MGLNRRGLGTDNSLIVGVVNNFVRVVTLSVKYCPQLGEGVLEIRDISRDRRRRSVILGAH